jgi:hypothetical protein
MYGALMHNPGKACPGLDPGWKPVFRRDHAQAKKLERDADPTITHHILVAEDHTRAERDAVVEIDGVIVRQPDAAEIEGASDRLRRVGSVNAHAAIVEDDDARAERIAWFAFHHAGGRELAFDHVGRRLPLRPFLLAGYFVQAGDARAGFADADAITQRHLVRLDQIKKMLLLIDDDRADRMGGAIKHRLTPEEKGHFGVGRAAIDAGREVSVERSCRLVLDFWPLEQWGGGLFPLFDLVGRWWSIRRRR